MARRVRRRAADRLGRATTSGAAADCGIPHPRRGTASAGAPPRRARPEWRDRARARHGGGRRRDRAHPDGRRLRRRLAGLPPGRHGRRARPAHRQGLAVPPGRPHAAAERSLAARRRRPTRSSRLLALGRPAIDKIESLDQHGLLVRLIPEWAAVRNKPQRNAYHTLHRRPAPARGCRRWPPS